MKALDWYRVDLHEGGVGEGVVTSYFVAYVSFFWALEQKTTLPRLCLLKIRSMEQRRFSVSLFLQKKKKTGRISSIFPSSRKHEWIEIGCKTHPLLNLFIVPLVAFLVLNRIKIETISRYDNEKDYLIKLWPPLKDKIGSLHICFCLWQKKSKMILILLRYIGWFMSRNVRDDMNSR